MSWRYACCGVQSCGLNRARPRTNITCRRRCTRPVATESQRRCKSTTRGACRNAYITLQCNNCHESRKPCNNGRPCQRCIKRGLSSSCVNHRRKRRAPPPRKLGGSSAGTSSTTTSHSSSRPGSFSSVDYMNGIH
ncbi:hypothetical protein LXA43DRAFT_83291 [Ganoderma leucocontextum]|nr:hypothetical protein LXA43DRAFT_83291 [Ganoderma leucocontextum]